MISTTRTETSSPERPQFYERVDLFQSSAYDLAVWQAQDRRPESLLVAFGLGAAAHIAGSSLILLLAGRARRQPEQGLLPSDGDPEGPATLLEPQEPQPDTTRPFDPRPNG